MRFHHCGMTAFTRHLRLAAERQAVFLSSSNQVLPALQRRCFNVGTLRRVLSSIPDERHHFAFSSRDWGFSARSSSSRRYLSESSLSLPHGSLNEKIDFFLNEVPVGSLSAEHVDFAHKTIHSLSRRMYNRGELAEKILERLVADLSFENPAIETGRVAVLYNGAIRSWARTQDTEEPLDNELPRPVKRAKEILERMKSRHERQPRLHPKPDIYAYDAVLYACATTSFPERVTVYAEDLVKFMESCVQQNPKDPAIAPSTVSYNNLISVYANQAPTHYGAATAAEDWLMHLSRLSAEGFGKATPDTRSFNRVLKAWGNSPESKGADRAKEILELMLRLQADHDDIQPDPISFATVIHAFARRQQPEGAEAVFKLSLDYFHRFIQEQHQQQDHDSPTEEWRVYDLRPCLNGTIFAWSQSGKPEAVERVKEILRDARTLTEHYESMRHPSLRISPDAASHSAFIHALVKSGRPDAIDDAERHLKNMISSSLDSEDISELSSSAFNNVIDGWWKSNRPEAAERALQLLELMFDAEMRGAPCAPESTTFLRCIDLLAKHRSPAWSKKKALLLLDLAEDRKAVTFFTYRSVINVLRKERHNAFDALLVLGRMERMGAQGLIDLNSCILHTVVIDELAKLKTPEAAEKALDILRKLKSSNLKPSTFTYKGVLDSFSSLQSERSGEVASQLYDEMKALDSDPSSKVLLETHVFRVVLENLAGSRGKSSADKACSVIKDMLRLLGEGKREAEPDSRCWDACLFALYNVNTKDYTMQAVQVLEAAVKKNMDRTLRHSPSRPAFEALYKRTKSHGLEKEAERVHRAAQCMAELGRTTTTSQQVAKH